MPEPKDPQPHWKITVVGAVAMIGTTIGGWSEVSNKTSKSEHEALKKEVIALDKSQALSAKDAEHILKSMEELKGLMREVSKNQNIIMLRMAEPRENFIGPPAPNPLNR